MIMIITAPILIALKFFKNKEKGKQALSHYTYKLILWWLNTGGAIHMQIHLTKENYIGHYMFLEALG